MDPLALAEAVSRHHALNMAVTPAECHRQTQWTTDDGPAGSRRGCVTSSPSGSQAVKEPVRRQPLSSSWVVSVEAAVSRQPS